MVAARSALRATQNGGGDGGSPVSPEGPLPAARSAPSPPRSRGAPPVCWAGNVAIHKPTWNILNQSHRSFDYHSKFRSSHGASWRKGHTASAIQGTCCQGQGCSEELILLLKENQDLMRMCLGLCSLQRALLREKETDDSEEEETPLLHLTMDPQLQQGPSLQSPTPTTPEEPGSSSSSHSRQQILSSSAIAGDLSTSPCCWVALATPFPPVLCSRFQPVPAQTVNPPALSQTQHCCSDPSLKSLLGCYLEFRIRTLYIVYCVE
ncbi:uncharacterized protein LOC116794659 isoform X1 [Chiroxiphia lanceolata]|uniref:uncharacterized protein LOC116794659 isoform X1 n=1 Tax=Chiroxiphia lanceolata TaxID=296741 RepID=UPI0013CF3E2C|nr:uncharacterized protein LOC116794659 isoform X1 [Chiroxiphia lanceolata]